MTTSPSNPTGNSEAMPRTKTADPCILIILGATGDLTARKLVPSLYNLAKEGLLPAKFACVGFARRDWSHEFFREEMHAKVNEHSRLKPVDEKLWETFSSKLYYHQAGFEDDKGYEDLKALLEELDKKHGTQGNRVFYLSIQPSSFPIAIEKLSKHGLLTKESPNSKKWSRIIIEKPFGHDLESAIALQKHIDTYMNENQVYRIDHYLGKETVQNLLTFRFANSIFEALWNSKYVDHVQFTVGEDIGVGTRGHFWEEAGMLRDIVQNHMMQLLSIIAMEPPTNLQAYAVHDEKVKVLDAIRPIRNEDCDKYAVRGQYGQGVVNGQVVKGYRKEGNVNPNSNVETYVALQLFIDNWRWAGVPFFLRAGKRMPTRTTEIAIVFKEIPRILFRTGKSPIDTNVLLIRIQPNEGISMKMNCKVPGMAGPTIQGVNMDFRYDSYFGMTPPDAYERLICDCILGDSTLFARNDEVLSSWKLLTPISDRWAEAKPKDFPNYQAGTWGPQAADEMLSRAKWRSWQQTTKEGRARNTGFETQRT